jgi:transposase
MGRNFSTVARVGLDLAKRAFQVHAVDAKGEIVGAQTHAQPTDPVFAELPPCVVAMEACSSAHHWGQALIALGHEVRLLSPAHVKPSVRRNKNDPVDAAAICEARSRPERTDSNSGPSRLMPGSAGGNPRIEVDGLGLPLLIKGAILSWHR